MKLLLAVGSNLGDPEDAALQYAHADAERVARLFVELGGVAPDRAVVVLGQPATAIRERLAELAGRIRELAAAGQDVVLLVYFSGHARGGELHLSGSRLPLAEVRELVAGTRARLRVLMVDACDSGAIARKKGGAPGAEFDVRLEKLPLAGQVVISSSGPSESAQEWESLGGSLFTHHLLTGLRGDADGDGDGKVTLPEAYAYAYRRTVANAALGAQHPSFDFDLAGAGELVLSEPAAQKSALVFPAELEGHYVVASQPRPDVVAEVDKEAGRVLRLAVPSGRYLVRKRLGVNVGLLDVELPYGGTKVVDEAAMKRRNFTEVVMKGGYLELRPSAVAVAASGLSETLVNTGARLRLGLAYRHTWGEKWAVASLGVGTASYRGVDLRTDETSVALGLSGGLRWLTTPLVPLVGLLVELSATWQRYLRDQEADIQRVWGQGPLPGRRALGVGFGPVVGVEVPLPASTFALACAELLVRHLPADGQPAWTLGAQGQLVVGWRF